MSPSDLEVEVYTIPDCPASDATTAVLNALGCPFVLKLIGKGERYWLNYMDYLLSPVVFVWRGQGKQRARWISWEGHKPQMLGYVNAELLKAGA